MMRKIALTIDYEIFGNGTGDVRQHVTDPTDRMALHCEQVGAPLTIFVEVEEFLAFSTFRNELQRELGYDPAEVIRKQLVDLARRGHDLQLHLHPQWVGARYASGAWQLRPDVQTVDDAFPDQTEATDYIRARKQVIDDILAEAGVPQRVTVYRAGAFSAQPGKKLINALELNGISVDSSVVYGYQQRNEHLLLDYRNAPSGRRHWKIRDDVAVEDPSGNVWEVPIHSVMGRRLFQATIRRMRAKFSRNVPKSQQKALVSQLGVRSNPFKFLKFLLQPVPIKLDFHNLSPAKLMRWISSAPSALQGEVDALVLIGHTKEHVDDAAFAAFLERASKEAGLQIVSMTHIGRALRDLECSRTGADSTPEAAVTH